MTAQDIEIAVAAWFGYRVNLIVPNVSWGWGLLHEADMLVLRPSGLCDEVEIKVSAADIRRDAKKRHDHWNDPRICRVWFAVPEALADCPDIPPAAGILAVLRGSYRPRAGTYGGTWAGQWRPYQPGDTAWQDRVEVRRQAKVRRRQERQYIMPEQRLKMAELAAMRIWQLKTALADCARRRQAKVTT